MFFIQNLIKSYRKAVTHLCANNLDAGHFGANILPPRHLGVNPLLSPGTLCTERVLLPLFSILGIFPEYWD